MSKHTIDLNQPFMDLDETAKTGLKATETKLASVLGRMLAFNREGDALKYLGWAIDLTTTGKLELDEADKEHLLGFIKADKQQAVLVRGQLLRAFSAAKG
jgi:hypothetical protein